VRSLVGSITSLATGKMAAPPVSYAAPGRFTTTSFAGHNGSETYMRTMATAGTVFQIVSLLATATAAPEWRLYRKPARDGRVRYTTGDRGTDQRTEVLQHQALNVWNKPNSFTTGRRFREASQQHAELTGEQWWVVTRDARATFPTGMWLVRPDRMEPIPSAKTYLAGYVYTGPSGEKVPLGVEDVILTAAPNPLDPYRGLGPVQSILVDIDAMKYSAEWNRNFFANSAVPGGIVTVPTNLSDEEFDQFTTRWREAHQGVSRAHRVAVLEGGATWTANQMSLRDMDFSNLREVSRDVLREAWGIHKSMLGNAENVNRCHDDQTEVLTDSGWKPFDKVEDGDRIATVNPETRALEYHAPIHTFAFDYSGPMVRLSNRLVDMKVTPNHTMLINTPGRAPWRTLRADDLPARFNVMNAIATEDAPDQARFALPAVEYANGHVGRGDAQDLPMDAWLAFLGWVISEGGILSEERAGGRYVMTLAQKKYPQQIRDCLAALPFAAHEYYDNGDDITRWNITGKGLISWLRQHVGTNCHDKRIPRWCFDLSLRQRRILFDAMMAGDGSRDPRPGRTSGYYATASPGLADDVLEFAFRLGYRANMARHQDSRAARAPMYYVHLTERAVAQVLEGGVTTENYEGKVYSFEVPNHVYVTRRNGRIGIHGNSNAATAEEVFGRWKILPRLDAIKDTLNHQYLPMFGSTGEGVEFDYDNPLNGDRESDNAELAAKTTAYATLVQAGVDPDAAAEVVGLPPMKTAEVKPPPTPPALPPGTGDGTDTGQDGTVPADGTPAENRAARESITLAALRNANTKPQPDPGDTPPDLTEVDQAWQQATDQVTAAYTGQITPDQQQQATDQIRDAVEAAALVLLAALLINTADAKTLLLTAMVEFSASSAHRASREASAQGVSVMPASPPQEMLAAIAEVTADLMGKELAVSAGREALRVAATGAEGPAVAEQVQAFLSTLSDAPIRTHLGGAMSAAQNLARHATFTQPGAARCQLISTEVLDSATCVYCEQINGTVFGWSDDPAAVASSLAAYPVGGYIDCLGREKCRGTLIARYETPAEPQASDDTVLRMLRRVAALLDAPDTAHINGHELHEREVTA
jgi:HK97 family phage portal protein